MSNSGHEAIGFIDEDLYNPAFIEHVTTTMSVATMNNTELATSGALLSNECISRQFHVEETHIKYYMQNSLHI
jgi:hypothetical protein